MALTQQQGFHNCREVVYIEEKIKHNAITLAVKDVHSQMPGIISLHTMFHYTVFVWADGYVGWGCILTCFMLSSLLWFPAFGHSAITTSHDINFQ